MTAAPPTPRVWPDAEALVAGVVAELAALRDAGRLGQVVLTGGTLGASVNAAWGEHWAATGPDGEPLLLWWGDERFVPAGHPDRNDLSAARLALASGADMRCVPAPPDVADPSRAARAYADDLAELAPVREDGTRFDLVLLGVGPDGHVASLFPGRDCCPYFS